MWRGGGRWEVSDAGDMFVIKTPELVCSRLFTLSQVSYHHNEYLLRIFSQNTPSPPHHHHISSPSRIFALGTLEKNYVSQIIDEIFISVDRHEISLEGKYNIIIIGWLLV